MSIWGNVQVWSQCVLQMAWAFAQGLGQIVHTFTIICVLVAYLVFFWGAMACDSWQ